MDFNELILSLNHIHDGLKEYAIKAVNSSLTLRNWYFGFYIVCYEQDGKDRAEYGKALLANIASKLKIFNIPNTDERELRRYRQFFLTYPDLKMVIGIHLIRELESPELSKLILDVKKQYGSIRGIETPELKMPQNHYHKLVYAISYSHFVELIRVDNFESRTFYELECMRQNWSVKELKRQIGSLLFERTISAKAKCISTTVSDEKSVQSINSLIRNPYVFEFISLKTNEVLSEKQLEQHLIDNLQDFLLELGKGFCFEARQKRITIDNEHYFVDIVFYHRVLHCNVLIELKTERFHHSHVSQLNLYLQYYKKYEMSHGDNPPIGILLCTAQDNEYVEFATAAIDENLFVSQYMLALPDKKELEDFLKKNVIGS